MLSKWILVPCTAALFTLGAAACDDDEERRSCDPAAPDCPEGEVCVASSEGDAFCEAPCDPLDPDACSGDKVCDPMAGGLHSCFHPVYVSGLVFDIDDGLGIEDAHVIAANESGAAVTDVSITGVDGSYELRVPITRDPWGVPTGTLTLRAAADGYLPYPHGIRPAIPVDGTQAVEGDSRWSIATPTTDVALIPLPQDQQGLGSIAGHVEGDHPGGALVVAECGAPPCPLAFADLSGDYVIFNVAPGDYTVKGYKAGLSLEPAPVTLGAGEHLTDVDLLESSAPLGSVSGTLNIVNPGDGDGTSVVLVPESAFLQLSETFVRGEVPPGLRDPAPGLAPDVTGAFAIEGIPQGSYVVLAAFENDFLVRDPDPSIAGTQILHLDISEAAELDVTIASAFKVTGALTMIGPGAEGAEAVDPDSLVFEWADDSSEDFYSIIVYDAFGGEVWADPAVPRVTGSPTVTVTYDGSPLDAGMYYQWRAVSHRDSGPISTTEDLLGVFYVPGVVE